MKSIVLALVSLAASSALAGAAGTPFNSCEPYTVFNSDNDYHTVYPCGTNYTIRHRSCIEGKTEIFWEQVDTAAENMQPVARTCRNGSFFPRTSKPVVHRGCIEGKVEIFPEMVDTASDVLQPVHYLCRGGRFVKLN